MHRTVGAAALAEAEAVASGEVVEVAAPDEEGQAGTEADQAADPWEMAKGPDEMVEVDVEVAPGSVASPGVEDSVALAAPVAAAVAAGHADRTGSSAEAASEDFASRPADCHPNCSRQPMAQVLDRAAVGSGREHPIVDPADRQARRAGTPVDVRLAEVARRLGWAYRLWAAL